MSQTTKRALEAALKELLQKKPLDKVTINDIANACGINRMTFYYHFRDIYDLVEWSCEEDAARALQGKKTYETWQQGLTQIFNLVLENNTFILNVYHSIGREQIEQYLYRLTYNVIMGVVEEQAEGMHVNEQDKAFIVDVYKYALVGLMLEWVREGMKEDPGDIVERLSRLVNGNISSALSNYEKGTNLSKDIK